MVYNLGIYSYVPIFEPMVFIMSAKIIQIVPYLESKKRRELRDLRAMNDGDTFMGGRRIIDKIDERRAQRKRRVL